MTPEQIAAKEAETAAAKKAADEAKAKAEADEALKNKKPERTRLEKLRHTEASIKAQIAEEEAKSGIIIDDEDDNKPLTRGDLKRIERDNAKKTSLQMANDLEDEDERSRVTELLETRIIPSGNPQKDLDLAIAAARSEKNAQIAAEMARKKTPPSNRSSGTGAPQKEDDQFVPTETELAAAAMVGKKTPADIKAFVLKARSKEQK
jgi:hypothetical protein